MPKRGEKSRAPRPLYPETEEEREAREHYEFGARYGTRSHDYDYLPESARREPHGVHYDTDLPKEAKKRPVSTDDDDKRDDEKFSMDLNFQTKDIYQQKKQVPEQPLKTEPEPEHAEVEPEPLKATEQVEPPKAEKPLGEKPSSGQVSDPTTVPHQKPVDAHEVKAKEKKDERNALEEDGRYEEELRYGAAHRERY